MEPIDLNRLAEQASGKPVDLNDLAGTAPEPAPERKRSILHPISVPFLLAVPAALATWPPRTADPELEILSHTIGTCIGYLIFASLLGLLAGWLSTRRVGNIVLCLILSLQTAGVVAVGIRHDRADAQRRAAAKADAALKSISSKAPEDVTPEDRKTLAATLDQTSQHLDNKGSVIVASTAATVRQISPFADDMQAKMKALNEGGGLGADGLTSIAIVEARIASCLAVKDSAEKLAAQLRAAPDIYRKNLVERGVPEDRAKTLANGFAEGGMFESAARLRALDSEILGHAAAMLAILRDHWGKWHVDPGAAGPTWTDPDPGAIGAYNQHSADLQAASDAQLELQSAMNAAPKTP
jgi:hypothetical protein